MNFEILSKVFAFIKQRKRRRKERKTSQQYLQQKEKEKRCLDVDVNDMFPYRVMKNLSSVEKLVFVFYVKNRFGDRS